MIANGPVWSRVFDDPIPLPDGRVLVTLHDAGHYAAALPKAEWKIYRGQGLRDPKVARLGS
jgi:hypothetical protein